MAFVTQRDKENIRGGLRQGLQRDYDVQFGLVATVDGSILSGDDFHVWVQPIGSDVPPIRVFAPRGAADLVEGLEVEYREAPEPPEQWQLVQIHTTVYASQPDVLETLDQSNVTAHWSRHTVNGAFVGSDPGIIYDRMIARFRMEPTNPASMRLLIQPGVYAGVENYVFERSSRLTDDLTSRVPATAGKARLVAIAQSNDGTLSYVNGSEYDNDAVFVPQTALPSVSNTLDLLGIVRLYNGMTTITNAEFDHFTKAERRSAVDKVHSPDLSIEALTADNNGDVTIYGADIERGNIYANDFARKLKSETEGQLFNEYSSGVPTGWTEAAAANVTNTTDIYGSWYLENTNFDTLWDYRKQSSVEIESLASNFWPSFLYGPIQFRDGEFASDLSYRFGIYADNSGIDLDTFVRAHLYWNSSSGIWQVRGQSKDGTTQTDNAYRTLSFPLSQPLYFRLVVRNHTTPGSRKVRSYIGTSPNPKSHTLLQDNTFSATWGEVHWRMNESRGTGVSDYLHIGAVDYLGNFS